MADTVAPQRASGSLALYRCAGFGEHAPELRGVFKIERAVARGIDCLEARDRQRMLHAYIDIPVGTEETMQRVPHQAAAFNISRENSLAPRSLKLSRDATSAASAIETGRYTLALPERKY